MNCTICNNNLEAYIYGQLPDEVTRSMRIHLNECKACAKTYAMITLSDKVITEEKALQSNPYMATRVMAKIEALEQKRISKYNYILKPALITTLIVFALLTGILAGSLYKPTQAQSSIPAELVYMNDAELESLSVLAND
jgi:anti-sigma factor RsiW